MECVREVVEVGGGGGVVWRAKGETPVSLGRKRRRREGVRVGVMGSLSRANGAERVGVAAMVLERSWVEEWANGIGSFASGCGYAVAVNVLFRVAVA